jgi:hypothetical protein
MMRSRREMPNGCGVRDSTTISFDLRVRTCSVDDTGCAGRRAATAETGATRAI